MKALRWIRAAGLVAALVSVPAVQAAPCAGFTDVDSANPFCANVEWVKNRSLTLGCTSSTTYCPTSDVTRLQMAAFLNRLGTVLTPIYVVQTESSIGTSLAAPGLPVCETTDVAAENYPRRAVLDGIVGVTASATSQGVQVVTRHSTDAGTTWDQSLEGSYGVVTNNPSYDGFTLPLIGEVDLAPGTSYRFDVLAATLSGTAGSANVFCRLRVRIEHSRPTAPVDPQSGRSR